MRLPKIALIKCITGSFVNIRLVFRSALTIIQKTIMTKKNAKPLKNIVETAAFPVSLFSIRPGLGITLFNNSPTGFDARFAIIVTIDTETKSIKVSKRPRLYPLLKDQTSVIIIIIDKIIFST